MVSKSLRQVTIPDVFLVVVFRSFALSCHHFLILDLCTLPGPGAGSAAREHRFVLRAHQEHESNGRWGRWAPQHPRDRLRQPGRGADPQPGAGGGTAALEEWGAEQTGRHAGPHLLLEGTECEAGRCWSLGKSRIRSGINKMRSLMVKLCVLWRIFLSWSRWVRWVPQESQYWIGKRQWLPLSAQPWENYRSRYRTSAKPAWPRSSH